MENMEGLIHEMLTEIRELRLDARETREILRLHGAILEGHGAQLALLVQTSARTNDLLQELVDFNRRVVERSVLVDRDTEQRLRELEGKVFPRT